MSLNWTVKDVKDFETVCFRTDENGEKDLQPVTNALLFATMSIGIGEFTKKNELEVIKRMRVYQGVMGALMRKGDEPYYITAQHIMDHRGLSTNVGYESRAKFMKRIWAALDREVRYEEVKTETQG